MLVLPCSCISFFWKTTGYQCEVCFWGRLFKYLLTRNIVLGIEKCRKSENKKVQEFAHKHTHTWCEEMICVTTQPVYVCVCVCVWVWVWMCVRERERERVRQRLCKCWLAISRSRGWRRSWSVFPLCRSFREQIPTLTRLSSAWQSASSSLPAIGHTSSYNLSSGMWILLWQRLLVVSFQIKTTFDHDWASNVALNIKVDGLWHAIFNKESKVCHNLLDKNDIYVVPLEGEVSEFL